MVALAAPLGLELVGTGLGFDDHHRPLPKGPTRRLLVNQDPKARPILNRLLLVGLDLKAVDFRQQGLNSLCRYFRSNFKETSSQT